MSAFAATDETWGFELGISARGTAADVDRRVDPMDVVRDILSTEDAIRDVFGNAVQMNDIITISAGNEVRVARVLTVSRETLYVEPIAQVRATSNWRKSGQRRSINRGSAFVVITQLAKNITVTV